MIGGLSLAFSSTAFALQYLNDRGELTAGYGARAFPVLLMQDLAVVPMLAAIPWKSEPDEIVRETLESSLLVARKTLGQMKFPEELIDDFIEQFRKRDRERLLAQMDYGPEAGLDLLHQKFDREKSAT